MTTSSWCARDVSGFSAQSPKSWGPFSPRKSRTDGHPKDSGLGPLKDREGWLSGLSGNECPLDLVVPLLGIRGGKLGVEGGDLQPFKRANGKGDPHTLRGAG